MLVAAGLLLLALATYTPTDPSFNSVGGYVTGRPAHNWTGMVGAFLADAMLQTIGIATFFLPLMVGRLGLCWMRSRPAGSPKAKTAGLAMWVVFAPAAIALLPGNLLWRHALPIEGITGRLLADAMVHYLNLPGACIVLGLMVALSLYLATTFTFNTAREWAMIRFSFLYTLVERWTNWRNRRANARIVELNDDFGSKREQMEEKARRAREFAEHEAARNHYEAENTTLLGGLFRWLGRRKKPVEPISLAPEEIAATGEQVSMWQSMPRTLVDAPPVTALGTAAAAAAPFADALAKAAAPVHAIDDRSNFDDHRAFGFAAERMEMPEPKPARTPTPIRPPKTVEEFAVSGFAAPGAPLPSMPNGPISFGKRADADIKPVTIVPKSVRGYKLPPSSLLYRSDDQTVVRDDQNTHWD